MPICDQRGVRFWVHPNCNTLTFQVPPVCQGADVPVEVDAWALSEAGFTGLQHNSLNRPPLNGSPERDQKGLYCRMFMLCLIWDSIFGCLSQSSVVTLLQSRKLQV